MKAFFAVTLAMLFALSFATARADDDAYQRTLDKTVQASGARTLSVTGFNGNVHLYGDSGTTVRVHAILGARSADALKLLDVQTSRDGGTVSVKDVCPSTTHFIFFQAKDCDIQLEVHYPRALATTLTSQNGNVNVDGAGSSVRISNTNGNVRVNGAGGAVSVKNTNGNVTLADAPSDIMVTNTNGNVHANLTNAWRGSTIALSTHAGNVTLSVPSSFQAKLDAHTRMGNVRNNANLRNGPITVTAKTTFGNVVVDRE